MSIETATTMLLIPFVGVSSATETTGFPSDRRKVGSRLPSNRIPPPCASHCACAMVGRAAYVRNRAVRARNSFIRELYTFHRCTMPIMANYLIAYDLTAPDSDYSALIEALRDRGAHHPQESVWILRTGDTLPDVTQYVCLYVDCDRDRLLIYPITEDDKEYNSLNT